MLQSVLGGRNHGAELWFCSILKSHFYYIGVPTCSFCMLFSRWAIITGETPHDQQDADRDVFKVTFQNLISFCCCSWNNLPSERKLIKTSPLIIDSSLTLVFNPCQWGGSLDCSTLVQTDSSTDIRCIASRFGTQIHGPQRMTWHCNTTYFSASCPIKMLNMCHCDYVSARMSKIKAQPALTELTWL